MSCTTRVVSGILSAVMWIGATQAADFDGSKPFVCTLLDLNSCTAGGNCQAETPESADIPRFLFIDVQKGAITGSRAGGELLSTKIERMRTLDDKLVLEGAEGALSWTVTVSQTSGDMSLGAVGDGIGFLVFGACVRASPN